ncbi:hypothetical protein VTK73DRAFT_7345 [Phialemonium thermophilum]|uniref:Uncharacterized protein n=1 Tax=Phialemonium thermophilum TaxID=223376 RepID=A0ABR3WF13_9PEZI
MRRRRSLFLLGRRLPRCRLVRRGRLLRLLCRSQLCLQRLQVGRVVGVEGRRRRPPPPRAGTSFSVFFGSGPVASAVVVAEGFVARRWTGVGGPFLSRAVAVPGTIGSIPVVPSARLPLVWISAATLGAFCAPRVRVVVHFLAIVVILVPTGPHRQLDFLVVPVVSAPQSGIQAGGCGSEPESSDHLLLALALLALAILVAAAGPVIFVSALPPITSRDIVAARQLRLATLVGRLAVLSWSRQLHVFVGSSPRLAVGIILPPFSPLPPLVPIPVTGGLGVQASLVWLSRVESDPKAARGDAVVRQIVSVAFPQLPLQQGILPAAIQALVMWRPSLDLLVQGSRMGTCVAVGIGAARRGRRRGSSGDG